MVAMCMGIVRSTPGRMWKFGTYLKTEYVVERPIGYIIVLLWKIRDCMEGPFDWLTVSRNVSVDPLDPCIAG